MHETFLCTDMLVTAHQITNKLWLLCFSSVLKRIMNAVNHSVFWYAAAGDLKWHFVKTGSAKRPILNFLSIHWKQIRVINFHHVSPLWQVGSMDVFRLKLCQWAFAKNLGNWLRHFEDVCWKCLPSNVVVPLCWRTLYIYLNGAIWPKLC